jgi:short subunit dehydrogenase-like uncharacterized protein
MSSSRKYDVIIFGATGFSGKLIVKYMLKSADKKVRWAVAARAQNKLDDLLKELSCSVDTLVADVADIPSLDKMCSQATMILNCVGPFQRYGPPVVEACLRNNCHYADITGEPSYVQILVEKYHEQAKQKVRNTN